MPAGDRQEGQYQRGVTGRCGIRLAVVTVVALDRDRELRSSPHQKVVRARYLPISVWLSNCHAAGCLRSNTAEQFGFLPRRCAGRIVAALGPYCPAFAEGAGRIVAS